MTRLTWDETRPYSYGVDRGVFYPSTGAGEPWNGLTSVLEKEADASNVDYYVDGKKVYSSKGLGYFQGSIEAYTYPPSFYDDVLVPILPKNFGLSYRVQTEGGYQIHLVYNMMVSHSPYAYGQSQLDPELYRWPFSALPVSIDGVRRSAHLIIDSDIAYSPVIEDLEDILYGSDTGDARLPLPGELLDLFESHSILKVTWISAGMYEIEGPDDIVFNTAEPGINQIGEWPSVVFVSGDTWRISSL